MSDDQTTEFVDKQFPRPRFFHGEDEMIYIIDLKTRKMIDEKKRKKKKCNKRNKSNFRN